MASINGITIKNKVTWLGHEGYATQGDLYLDNEKIGFWSQDGDGGCDRFDFEEKYSEDKFIKALKELNKDKYYTYESNGVKHHLLYTTDILLSDLVELQELEEEYSKKYYHTDKIMVVISNNYMSNSIFLPEAPPNIDDKKIENFIQDKIDAFKDKYGTDNFELRIFHGIKDFNIGIPLQKEELYNFKKLERTFRWEMVIFNDKTITKEDFQKLDKEKQTEILNTEVIASTKPHCYYEKNYFLEFNKEEKNKEEIEFGDR